MRYSAKLHFSVIFLSIFGMSMLVAGEKTTPELKWTVNPFEQKVFIENKGQYEVEMNTPVLYKVEDNGAQVFFTSKGLIYKHLRVEIIEDEDHLTEEIGEEEEEEMKRTKFVPEMVSMEWLGSNPDVQIIAEDIATNYFAYPDLTKKGNHTIHAPCYKKIIYKNLYPNIDVEYFFIADKVGYKYNVILHPKADPTQIKMKYSGTHALTIDDEGNAQITTPFLKILDHAPNTYYAQGNTIGSSFVLGKDQVISFALVNHDNSKEAIIDPWTTVTLFTSVNKVYDVNYDNYGNAYAYGGSYPFELIKINSSGAIQWTYTASDFTASGYNLYYGDFALDEESGVSYLCEGAYLINGSRIIKVDSIGNRIGFFNGNWNLEEMWRMAYDPCSKTIVIGGGGVTNTYQAAILDTTGDMNITPVNILSATTTYRDIALLTTDGYKNCFMVSARGIDNLYNNQLIKMPLTTTLTPTTYSVASGHGFRELNSVLYVTPPFSSLIAANGYNGLAASNKYVYTYSGFLLKKWNSSDLTLVKSTNSGGQSFRSGGISVDACDNLYVGSNTVLKHYNINMDLVNTYNLPDSVYDVKVDDKKDIVYSCGKGFVSALEIPVGPCLNFTFTATETCTNTGVAEVSVTGGVEPYSYVWSTNPTQTTAKIENLVRGDYSVTVVDNSCISMTSSSMTTILPIQVYFALDTNANVFSPNGDGINDTYRPYYSVNSTIEEIENYVKSFYIKVYNRWGTVIYEGNDYKQGWAGKNNRGGEMPEGVYYYLAEYETNCSDPDTPTSKTRGYVHLIRK